MTPEQKEYYILGLEDAICELKTEWENVQQSSLNQDTEVLLTWRNALFEGISQIKSLIQVAELGSKLLYRQNSLITRKDSK